MSFDDFLSKRGYMRGYKHDYQIAFDYGAQSRQAEIEENYKIGYQDGFGSRQAEIDELQNKLKGAVKTNEMLVAYKNELLDEIESIVKGNKND